ncbi:MAG: SDR family NAD(P)-dependent oxidoreductase, partial [Acidobacteriota bacterium]
MSYRQMLVCEDLADAISALENVDSGRVLSQFQSAKDRPVIFMFPGQGSQYVNMGLDLYRNEAFFRDCIDHCSTLLKPYLNLDLGTILYPQAKDLKEAAKQLEQTYFAQPALFVIEYAMAKLWMQWGILPQAMIGHSLGEYVAACLAGVFSLEEGLALVAARGRLMQSLPMGAMLAVSLPYQEVESLLNQNLSIAAINGPSLCVVSGPLEAIDQFESRLTDIGVQHSRLHTSHAFHSQMMSPILETFAEQIKKVHLKAPKIPYISNLTATWITPEQATDVNYWIKQLQNTVRFWQGLCEVTLKQDAVLLEVGPGRTLSSLAKLLLNNTAEQAVVSSLSHAHDKISDMEFLLTALGKLWLAGVRIDWQKFYAKEKRQRLSLPTYPFERKSYWVKSQLQQPSYLAETVLAKRSNIEDWFYITVWQQAAPAIAELLCDQSEKSCCLVFVDNLGLGATMVKSLEEAGHFVVTVREGESFTKGSNQDFTICANQRDDYNRLLQELKLLNRRPAQIIHLWNVTSRKDSQAFIDSFEKFQSLGFYSLIYLAQAIEAEHINGQIQIKVISNDLQAVNGQEFLCLEKATLLGPCRVIPQEYPNITCQSIDITYSNSSSWREERLINDLIKECFSNSAQLAVAYRGGRRWVQSVEPFKPSAIFTKRLRVGGVYLITGGLGNIGLLLGNYLAETLQAKLILVGRTPFPQRDDWQTWLATHDENDSISQKLQRIMLFEKLGAEVVIATADVANKEQMEMVIADAYLRFGALNGVIHAAGIIGPKTFCTISELDQSRCEEQFQAKIHGLLVLTEILRNRELDFYLLLSSLVSLLGGLGFSSYCAANLFIDAFVQKHNQIDPIPCLGVNFDGWDFLGEKHLNTSTTELAIKPKEGIEVIRRIFATDSIGQLVISTRDLKARIDQWIHLKPVPEIEEPKQEDLNQHYLKPNLSTLYIGPRNESEQVIVAIWEEM